MAGSIHGATGGTRTIAISMAYHTLPLLPGPPPNCVCKSFVVASTRVGVEYRNIECRTIEYRIRISRSNVKIENWYRYQLSNIEYRRISSNIVEYRLVFSLVIPEQFSLGDVTFFTKCVAVRKRGSGNRSVFLVP